MLAASHGNIFSNAVLYLAALGGMLLTWGTLYIRVIYPRSQAHKIHEAERAGLQRALNEKDNTHSAFLDGVPDVPGMTPLVRSAAERLRALEDWREQFE